MITFMSLSQSQQCTNQERIMIKKLVLLISAIVLCGLNSVLANEIPANVVKESIVKQSLEMNIDPALALSIAKKESNYKHHLKSRHGAVGVYQLMPNTAKRLGVNPYYLNENIKGGLTYYKMMYDMFGSMEFAFAAYNAGPGNVKKYNAIPPFTETRHFVSKIMADYKELKNNPDPIMTKVINEQKKALLEEIATVPVSDVESAEDSQEIPMMNEIPEVREPSVEMETL